MSDPTPQAIAWATAQLHADAITRVVGLHAGESPWRLDYLASREARTAILRVADPDRVWGSAIVRAAAALTVAGDHDLPTARLIAVDADGSRAGDPALLETYQGESTVPDIKAMPSAGAALATIHRIHLDPTADLPVIAHHTPADDHPSDRRWARRYRAAGIAQRQQVIADLLRARPWMAEERAIARLTNTATSEFLDHADKRLSDLPVPGGKAFLHGDVWFGNMAWQGATCRGLLDWKAAGVGHPGVDLGSLRMRATFAFGAAAAAEATAAWEEAIGRRADAIAYWDAIAALHTPYDEHTDARDNFLDNALSRLS